LKWRQAAPEHEPMVKIQEDFCQTSGKISKPMVKIQEDFCQASGRGLKPNENGTV